MTELAEHEYVVEIPSGLQFEDITDYVSGWFKAEVQVIRCADCGKYEVGWRPAKPQNRREAAQE